MARRRVRFDTADDVGHELFLLDIVQQIMVVALVKLQCLVP